MPNRLATESSPYLRQHASNPVDWYPWGEEALARSVREDKPILLSVGYSACHWCHVMEHESFEDAETAALMNELFVSIKVDREERPDLDHVYQLTVQVMGRAGGWPLTVFLTPERKPFFAGTYFPPAPRYGMPSFREVLRAVHDAYSTRRADIESSAAEITEAITEAATVDASRSADVPRDVIAQAAARLVTRMDPRHGGFGDRPKFPNTMNLDVLARAVRSGAGTEVRDGLVRALDGMRDGGLHDHLGGGFHRYSTDERWLVPHFEKMLYDNALLARLYVDAFRLTGEARFADTARDVLGYVERELRAPGGGFYATQDADSVPPGSPPGTKAEEGAYFVWTVEQVREVLGEARAEAFCAAYGVTAEGNFEDTSACVLHVRKPLDPAAFAAFEPDRAALLAHRRTRPAPARDEKIIAAWNGLAIGAFAECGAALGDARLVDVARAGLDFARNVLFEGGELRRIHKDGETKVPAFLDDHAELASAALDVYEATFDAEALAFARALVSEALTRFWDEATGTLYFAPAGQADLVVRPQDPYDNAVPSGVSSMAHAMLRLGALTADETLLAKAERVLRTLVSDALRNPFGHGHALTAMHRYVTGPTEIVLVGDPADPALQALARVVHARFLPERVLACVAPGASPTVGEPGAGVSERAQRGGVATAYVCRDRTCSAPVTDPGALAALL